MNKKLLFRGYIPELDGLRAVGTVLVILNHVWPWGDANHAVFMLLQLPWMLMDAFFVLSGFLITGILLDTRERPDYYRSFYIRRSLRILPIYYLVLIFITFIAVHNGHAAYRQMLQHWGTPAWFFVYLGNIPTAVTGLEPLAAGGSYVPLWSLQIEEQFYLLFPLLVHRLRLETLTRVLLGLCCFSTMLRLVLYWRFPANEQVEYVLLPTHMEGLAMGAWLAVRFRQGPWEVNQRRLSLYTLLWCGGTLTAAAWGGFLHTAPFNRTIGFLLSPIACAYLIFWIIQHSGSQSIAWMKWAPVRYIGKISYAAYLLHWPIGNLLTSAAERLHVSALNQGLTGLCLVYAITFGVASLSWHFFERPLALLKDRLFPPVKVHRPA